MSRKSFSRFGISVLTLTLMLTLAGCERDEESVAGVAQSGVTQQSGASGQQSGTVQAADVEDQPVEEESFEVTVARAYANVLDNAASYDFGDDAYGSPSQPIFTYVLAPVADHKAPLLLVDKNSGSGVSIARVFSFNEAGKSVDAPEDVFNQGAASSGGFRGGFSLTVGESAYLQYSIIQGMRWETRIEEVAVNDGQMERSTLYEGSLDQVPSNLSSDLQFADLKWTNVSDKSLLEDYAGGPFETDSSKGADVQHAEGKSGESDVVNQDKENAEMLILEGTIHQFNHDELLAFQGVSDPNPAYMDDQIYTILALQEEQDLEFESVDGNMVALQPVRMIQLRNFSGVVPASNKTVSVRIDRFETWWAGDTSLPLGQPRSDSYEILQ